MLEELGVPYEVKYVNIGSGEQFEPSFLKIAPNNRMPAIVDPEGPGGEPISIFESGAILQYLGRKFGKFYPADERGRVEVEQWLFWQMGGLGPMAGQAHHFRQYAPEKIALCDRPLHQRVQPALRRHEQAAGRPRFLAGDYSIADMACDRLESSPTRTRGRTSTSFPNLKRWFEAMMARPAVERGIEVGKEERERQATSPTTRKRRRSCSGSGRALSGR